MEKRLYNIVTETMGADFFQNVTVLDVGCARYAESIALRDMGADVTALDVLKREEPPERIRFVLSNFLEWQPDQAFDVLYLSNSALFMPNADVFEKIAALRPKTVVVRTMYDYPEPNWDASQLKQLYFTKPSDWVDYFEPLGFLTMHTDIYEEVSPDMLGSVRTFRVTEYIGRRSD
ncbi:MAG: class I SAM-dependent methyltransferase [Candidatus Moraniibacteriota bacterium]